jgi:predicted RNA-binding Zn-ribbon protein involved in translation (DUF1610 family)
MQQNNTSCPDCGESTQLKRQKFGVLRTLSLGFLGDLGSLFVAIVLLTGISALSFTGAYGIAIIFVCGGGIYLHAKSSAYKCAKCDRVFRKQKLDTA